MHHLGSDSRFFDVSIAVLNAIDITEAFSLQIPLFTWYKMAIHLGIFILVQK